MPDRPFADLSFMLRPEGAFPRLEGRGRRRMEVTGSESSGLRRFDFLGFEDALADPGLGNDFDRA